MSTTAKPPVPCASQSPSRGDLLADGLTREYPTRGEPLRVLRGASLAVAAGESLTIMGPSGCGKSTLLHILGTLDRPTAGSLRIGGQDPFALSDGGLATFRNRTAGFVFQDHHLLPQCSSLENVLVPTLATAAGRRTSDAAKTRGIDLLRRVGLGERLDHRPAELSGGERQRVAIARALINQPRVLLADEPTGNLDADAAEQIAGLFVQLVRSERLVLIVVTHSPQLAARFDRTVELRRGVLSEPSRGGQEAVVAKAPRN